MIDSRTDLAARGSPPDTEPPRAERVSGAEATGFVDLGGVHRAIRELRPAYAEFEAARQRFQEMVDASLAKLPASTRDTAMAFLRREFPNMPGATPFAVPAPVASASSEGSAAVTNIAAALLHDVSPPGTADEQSAFLARVAEILQTTAQAFVEIRNVQARFGEEMGVRTIREFTPLHSAGDARGVLDYLLDWRRGGPERNAQLSAVYSDFLLHQVALINGVVEGVEGLMEQFRPAEIERGVGGLSKAAGAWKKYTERYAEVIEERGVAALVFGPEFARAYARVGTGN
jgi:predicted component of type VI protein secretion system